MQGLGLWSISLGMKSRLQPNTLMMPEMRVIRAVGCLANRKKQWSSDGFDLSQPSIKRVITQAIAAH